MTRFKIGDPVIVVSYDGLRKYYGVKSEYSLTKIGFRGVVKSITNERIYIDSDTFRHISVFVDDLAFDELYLSPLFQALL